MLLVKAEAKTEGKSSRPKIFQSVSRISFILFRDLFPSPKWEIKTGSFFFFFWRSPPTEKQQTFQIWMNKNKLNCHLRPPWDHVASRSKKVCGLSQLMSAFPPPQAGAAAGRVKRVGGVVGATCGLWKSLGAFHGKERTWFYQQVSAGLRAEQGSCLSLQTALDKTTNIMGPPTMSSTIKGTQDATVPKTEVDPTLMGLMGETDIKQEKK